MTTTQFAPGRGTRTASAASAAIRTVGLTKRYGRRPAVESLDLVVERGEIFGYLGPNGAGKTTTIRLLLDLIRPTSGRAQVLGLDAQRDSLAVRRQVGYLPGELALYETMTAQEMFRFFGALRGGADPAVVRELTQRLDLDPSRPIRELSKGNKQKVGLIQALLHRPALLILDEPTSGLDPLVQQEVHAILRETASAGGTVFLSSHTLSEVEHVADRVGILREGKLVLVQQVQSLKAKAVRQLDLHFATPVDPAPFAALSGVSVDVASGPVLSLRVTGSLDAVVKSAARHEVVNLVTHEPDLEEIFLGFFTAEV